MEFEWDAGKAASNLSKYGVSFEEAMTVFGDPLEMMKTDPVHSESEHRFLSLGLTKHGRLAVVSYTERDQKIRIIGARKATPREHRQYESTGQS